MDDRSLTSAGENPPLHRGLPFAYRMYEPEGEAGEVLVLLHGSGVDETVLAPLARAIAPAARLLAVRGRIMQEGSRRWFTRVTPTAFDQKSIRSEAGAFARFLPRVAGKEGFDLGTAAFLGYSNGANLASSVMLLHPGLIRRAALLRAMPVLDDVRAADLAGTSVLVVAGRQDGTYGPYAPALASLLERHGAAVESHIVPSGHEFGEHDAVLVRRWLENTAPAGGSV